MANSEVTPAVIDRLQDQWVAAAQRRIELDDAREMWPVRVNETLRLLAVKVAALEAKIARLEAVLG